MITRLSLIGIIVGALVAGGLALALGGGGNRSAPETVNLGAAFLDEAPSPTITPQPVSTPSPTTEPFEAVQAVAIEPRSCAAIRATGYENDAERAYFLVSCVTVAALPSEAAAPRPTISQPRPAAPQPLIAQSCAPPEVSVVSELTRGTYSVTGTSIPQINASMFINAPVSGGQKAIGLTAYRTGYGGTKCALPDSCAIGRYVVSVTSRITLPLHTGAALLEPELRTIWTAFVAMVSVHEDRHVTIAVEAMEEVKRQLLALDPKLNCDEVDHAIGIIWRLESEAMSRRQEAFHRADLLGQGGLVAR